MRVLHWLLCVLVLVTGGRLLGAEQLSHEAWDAMLQRYVTAEDRVDYASWKQDGTGALDSYLARLAENFPEDTTVAERQAALINAYNALTIRWVLPHFPVKSIWKTKKPFTEARHRVDGRMRSLDDIETELRESVGPLAHSVLVCAARSCPPLRREAYVAERLQEQLEDNTRQWLANPTKNEFNVTSGKVRVSRIFKWYRDDFENGDVGLEDLLARYAPPAARPMFTEGSGRLHLKFASYDWGLNDADEVGSGYRTFYLDYLRNK